MYLIKKRGTGGIYSNNQQQQYTNIPTKIKDYSKHLNNIYRQIHSWDLPNYFNEEEEEEVEEINNNNNYLTKNEIWRNWPIKQTKRYLPATPTTNNSTNKYLTNSKLTSNNFNLILPPQHLPIQRQAHSLDDRKFNIFYEHNSKGGTKNNKQFSSSHFSSFIPLKEMTRQNFVENNQEFLCREEMMEKFKNQKKRREKNKWEEEERNGGGSKILTEKRRNEWLNTKNILINNYSPSPSPSSFSSNNSIITSKSLNNLSNSNNSNQQI
uniref:Uncharacterized protein n=1 Tax=Meloidogyne floridensis TaxID=298350 RepID=A0A915PAQ5_9BILA